MAYPYYQPINYQPNYYNPYYQQGQNQIQQPQQAPQQPQIQNSGFVCVRSMDEVQNWAIAAGNSVTFYVETTPPVIATKTKGFSQLEMPVIKVFDLTERQLSQTAQNAPKTAAEPEKGKVAPYALKSDLTAIWSEIDAINDKLIAKEEKPSRAKKTEGENINE